MPNYIVLVNWTDQGIKNAKDTIKRAKSFEGAIEKAGGKSLGIYYTMGKHDIVAIVEAPNDEIIASVLYTTGSLGNIRTETLKAFSMAEAAKIIEKLLVNLTIQQTILRSKLPRYITFNTIVIYEKQLCSTVGTIRCLLLWFCSLCG